jgi:hypothetical protein
VFFEHLEISEFNKQYAGKYNEKINLFLTDPPFNVLPDEIKISLSTMELVAQMAESYLAKGGTLLIFCAIDQIALYKQYLDKTTLTVEPMVLNIINDINCNYYL